MHIIIVYDINTEDAAGQRRLTKALKVCRKYLTHVQKSVFEGVLPEGKLAMLRRDLMKIVDIKKDFVIIYSLPEGVNINRDILTDTPDPMDNFL